MEVWLWIPLLAVAVLFLAMSILLMFRELFRTKVLQWAHHHKSQVKDEAKWVWLLTFLLTLGVGIGEYVKSGNPVMSAEYTSMAVVGLVLLALGFNTWLKAMVARKQFLWFLQVLEPKEELPPYSTNGIYATIRNPRDLGLLLVVAGLACALLLKFMLVFTVLLLLATAYRVSSRDRVLIEKYGKEYANYMNRTRKLIPYIY
ncbi:MAG: methyltransferase [Candidatus Woesearchaeota archaeon]